MPVTFKEHKWNNRDPIQTVESAIKAYTGWAAIHDHHFLDTVSSDSIVVTGGYKFDKIFGNEVVFYYHVAEHGHGIIFNSDMTAGTKRKVEVSLDATGMKTYVDDVLASHYADVTVPTEGDYIIAFRELIHSESPGDRWLAISVWANDLLIGSYTHNTGIKILTPIECELRGTLTYTNVRVPQLTEFSEYATIDPGESPAGGLKRLLDGRYIKYFVRFDGSFKAWRSSAIKAVKGFLRKETYAQQESFDKRQLYSHIRMMGAYYWAEHLDFDMIQKFGHRFLETNNPYLMHDYACRQEAIQEVRRRKEDAYTKTFKTAYRPTVEQEDHIIFDGEDWIVSGISTNITRSSVKTTFSCRQYAYDEFAGELEDIGV